NTVPVLVNNPWEKAGTNNLATSYKWHYDGADYDSTRGNNVHAYLDAANRNSAAKPNFSARSLTSQPALSFNYTSNYTIQPADSINRLYNITNLFYWNNIIHDITYQYGFTEAAGNFQNTNAFPVRITEIKSYTLYEDPSTANIYMKGSAINGAPGAISAANGWNLVATNDFTPTSTTTEQVLVTGQSIIVAPNSTVGLAVEIYDDFGGSLAYSGTGAGPTGVQITSGGGCNLITGSNVGYGGVEAPAAPTFTVRAFIGSITFEAVATTPCSGTPAPGNTVSSVTSACSGASFNLSLQNPTAGMGVTYQWQSSATGVAGSFTNIAGATGSTYAASQTAATYYQAIVTCAGSSTTSNPVSVALTPLTSCYCVPPNSDCTDGDIITNVLLGTLNNPSPTCGSTGYTNYTTNTAIVIPDVVAGATNPIAITAGTGVYTVSVGLWIDYNRNGVFDASEFTLINTAASPLVRNGNIVVPSTALLGQTRMRVRVQFSAPIVATGACDESYIGFGETEDYLVNIIPCVPASITTQPVSVSAVCGNTATLSIALAGSLPAGYWQVRTSATAPWNAVANTAPYSGVATTTLTISPVTANLNGYQYRFLYQGACTGVDFSNAATLTVTPFVTTVTPTAATICNGSVQQLSILNSLSSSVTWTENFDVAIPLPAGWAQQNNSAPLGPNGWLQGNPTNFSSFNGAASSYITALWSSTTTTGAGDISNWLFTPVTSIKNGDQIKFYTRNGGATTEYPDRLEVRVSTSGTSTSVGTTALSTGDYSNLILSINPTLVTNVYPKNWTEFTATVSGVTGTVSGRIAFRYFVTNGGGTGANSDVIGLDNVRYVSAGSTATGVWTGPAGTIFTDATAATAYVAGTPASSVYVKPTANGVNNYQVVVTTPTCVAPAVTIPVTVNQSITGTSTTANAATCVGGNASFTASAPTTGAGILHQWKFSTDNGATYSNVVNSAVYGGATTATLTITGATTAMNGYRFRDSLYVPGCNSFIFTNAATLTVNPLPVLTITASPSASIYPGQTATIAVASSTTIPAGGYRWTRNGMLLQGVTGNSLVVDVDSIGTYSVSAADANACGSALPATIAVTAAENTAMFVYPSPNSGQFQVRYYSAAGNNPLPRVVNVYDSKGARVYSKTYNVAGPYSRMDVVMPLGQKGVYQVELTDRSGARLKTGRVVIL
ncbi:MAG: hypothetical protein EOP51_14785, partial [Sphingobacteriales bacterium]